MLPRHAWRSAVLPWVALLLFVDPACGQVSSGGVQVSETVLFGEMDCFQIETPMATYV